MWLFPCSHAENDTGLENLKDRQGCDPRESRQNHPVGFEQNALHRVKKKNQIQGHHFGSKQRVETEHVQVWERFSAVNNSEENGVQPRWSMEPTSHDNRDRDTGKNELQVD